MAWQVCSQACVPSLPFNPPPGPQLPPFAMSICRRTDASLPSSCNVQRKWSTIGSRSGAVGWVIQLAFQTGSAANPALESAPATNNTKATAKKPRLILHQQGTNRATTILSAGSPYPFVIPPAAALRGSAANGPAVLPTSLKPAKPNMLRLISLNI